MSGALLGRTEERTRIDALIHRATSGPAALVLTGEPGIGKTAIWTQAVADAGSRHAVTVLVARAVEAEAAMADVVLADLLGPVVERSLPDLPGRQADALATALLLDRHGGPVDPRVVGMATLTVLRDLARVRPILVAIDDLQWVDPASGDALGFALRRAWQAGVPIGLLATMRAIVRQRPPALGRPLGRAGRPAGGRSDQPRPPPPTRPRAYGHRSRPAPVDQAGAGVAGQSAAGARDGSRAVPSGQLADAG